MADSPNEPQHPPPLEAATVVVIRDGSDGIETLMLRKNSKIHFGGMWVFPGGKVDAADDVGGADDELVRFRHAAVREASEEAGISLDVEGLVYLSHWLPPAGRRVRFSTHFFLAAAPQGSGAVAIDGGEIVDHAWLTPAEALARRHRGDIELVTPTFVTLDWLSRRSQCAEALRSSGEPNSFHTRIVETDEGRVALYHGDTAYDSQDLSSAGPRRRANMLTRGWSWEEHDGDGNGPAPPLLRSYGHGS
jgi:8-oxo-dGTP pyrophosphatase MutT (NUDIX family)